MTITCGLNILFKARPYAAQTTGAVSCTVQYHLTKEPPAPYVEEQTTSSSSFPQPAQMYAAGTTHQTGIVFQCCPMKTVPRQFTLVCNDGMCTQKENLPPLSNGGVPTPFKLAGYEPHNTYSPRPGINPAQAKQVQAAARRRAAADWVEQMTGVALPTSSDHAFRSALLACLSSDLTHAAVYTASRFSRHQLACGLGASDKEAFVLCTQPLL